MRANRLPRLRADREVGDTLIEVLVALVIIGIAFSVLVGGIGTAILGAGIQQNQSAADALLKSDAEYVLGLGYSDCATTYGVAPPLPGALVQVAVSSVAYWDPASNSYVATCSADSGLQLVTLTATANRPDIRVPGGTTLQVVKRS